MAGVRVMVLRAAGVNCDLETVHAWTLAGATPERVHVRTLIDKPAVLNDYQILTLPGGFSYGDDIAAGRILAAQLRRHLADALTRFVERGGLILGICNGFQALVQTGLLPFPPQNGTRTCTIAANDPPGFQDRWVVLRGDVDHCIFLEPGRQYEMPIAHGEGRVLFSDDAARAEVERGRHAALRYVAETAPATTTGAAAPPANPNGSTADIAGLCDRTGQVLGLMPHPERFVRATQHPCWTSRSWRDEGDGLALFRSAVAHRA